MSEQPDITVDTIDVMQEEGNPGVPLAPLTVPVVVEGPVRVQGLPAKSSGMRRVGVGTDAYRLLGSDPRRRRAVILASAAIYVADSQAQIGSDFCAKWPSNTALELTATSALYVAAQSGTADVTVIAENWAD